MAWATSQLTIQSLLAKCASAIYSPIAGEDIAMGKNKNQEFLAFSITFIRLLRVDKQDRQLALTSMGADSTNEYQLVHPFPCWWTLGWFQVCLATSSLLSLCVQFLGAPCLTVEVARQETCRSAVLWACINIIGINLCLPRCARSDPLQSSPTW